MDPLTHALSGAVAARAILPNYSDERISRTARWTMILGSIFPDIDIVANPFDPDHFATIRIHRSVTHSLVCLPVWAFLFALLAAWFCRWRGIAAPRRSVLGVLFGAGIGLHILFDCITSFGTMVWSPVSWSRVQFDWTFIIDLALTGILLFFLLLSWVAGRTERRTGRAAWMFVLMGSLTAVYAVESYALGQSLPLWLAAGVLLASTLPLATALFGGGVPLAARTWCRVGVLATAVYLGANAWAHARALERVREYAAAAHLEARELAAIPLPPNLNLWAGFALTGHDVHLWRFSLTGTSTAPLAAVVAPAVSGELCPPVLWTIPQVRAWMRFARFPVVVCGPAPGGESAEFVDLRFERPQVRDGWSAGRQKTVSFTWRVTFDGGGRVLSEGWVVE